MPAPKKPATTPSLPGAQSTRTDGGIADKQVQRQLTGWNPSDTDTNASFAQIESGAPMAQTSKVKAMSNQQIAQGAQQGAPLPNLMAPSSRPWEHITTPATLPAPVDPRQQENNDLISRYLPDLEFAAQQPGAPDTYLQFVNYLKKQVQ